MIWTCIDCKRVLDTDEREHESECPECHRCFDCATPECSLCGPCAICGKHHGEPWCPPEVLG